MSKVTQQVGVKVRLGAQVYTFICLVHGGLCPKDQPNQIPGTAATPTQGGE